jgi:hypothetical protein
MSKVCLAKGALDHQGAHTTQTLDIGHWTLDIGLWTLDFGQNGFAECLTVIRTPKR